jgi:hypothetical protein
MNLNDSFFQIKYRSEKMLMTSILTQIQEAIRLCREAGRKPIALVFNPKVLEKLYEDLQNSGEQDFRLSTGYSSAYMKKLLGLTIFEHPEIKDFYLIDNRSWAEQKW